LKLRIKFEVANKVWSWEWSIQMGMKNEVWKWECSMKMGMKFKVENEVGIGGNKV